MRYTDSQDLRELLERVEALEQRGIGINDLPMRKLQDKLEQDWLPNPSVMLPPRSITAPLLASQTVAGVVSGAGVIRYGTGFTVVRSSTGSYTVTFKPAFAGPPAVTYCGFHASTETVPRTTADGSVSAVSVLFVKRSDGTVVDTDFHFMAYGPRA